jgi:BirA family biotin operon repressor/biotin-[acetyl-CoA-carboxylase] ligase
MDRTLAELILPTRWVGRRLELYRELDSTNRLAEERASRGAPEGTLVIADGQTAGRGRLGRSFFSPAGTGLYLSLVLRPRIPADRAPEYIFAAAVAVAETVRTFVPPDVRVEIKWPNDVLLDGRKTSGINLPAHLDGDQVRWLVLGIGVNVNAGKADFPDELLSIATSLRLACDAPLDRVAFAEALLGRLEHQIDRLRDQGFPGVLEAWRDFFRMQGARVRVGGPGVAREIEGTVAGIDAGGALLVQTERARERVLAGDVTLLDPNPPDR